MFAILLHVDVKMKITWEVLWMIKQLYVRKLQNRTMKKQKLVKQISMKRK